MKCLRIHKLLYIIAYIIVAVVVTSFLASCSKSNQQARILSEAERIAYDYPDSALSILDIIEPSELSVDSLIAQYYLIIASIHDNQGHLQSSDSLIRYSAEYYRDKDIVRSVRSATLSALYDYWVCRERNAIRRLDSLANIADLPDNLAIFPLRKRAYWSSKLFSENGNRSIIKRLISIDRDSASQQLYKYWLYTDYLFENQNDSALIVLDELIDRAINSRSSAKQFSYEYEKMGLMEEMGNYHDCLELADKFLAKAPGNSIEHYVHLWKAMAHFNMGDRNLAIEELNKADSCATNISEAEKGYYNSFSYVLKSVYDFQKTGKLKLIHVAGINNRQKENLFRTQVLQQESEQNALISENKRLNLKAKNERQAAAIIGNFYKLNICVSEK